MTCAHGFTHTRDAPPFTLMLHVFAHTRMSRQTWNMAHEACCHTETQLASTLLALLLRLRKLSSEADSPMQMVAVHLTMAAASVETASLSGHGPIPLDTNAVKQVHESVRCCRQAVLRVPGGSDAVVEKQLITFEFKALAMENNTELMMKHVVTYMTPQHRPKLGIAEFTCEYDVQSLFCRQRSSFSSCCVFAL